MKKILSIMLAVIMSCSVVTGCGISKEFMMGPKRYGDEILTPIHNHLEEKYGNETFWEKSVESIGFSDDYEEYEFYSEKFKEQNGFVVIFDHGKVTDGYFGVLAAPKYKEVVARILQEHNGVYLVYVNYKKEIFDDKYTDVNKLKEYIAEDPDQFECEVSVWTPLDTVDKSVIKQLEDALKENFGKCSLAYNICSQDKYNDMLWEYNQ